MLKDLRVVLLAVALLNPLQVLAQTQNSIDPEIQTRIRKEAMDNSQIMRTLHFLTDVFGPRLTGSPNLKNAGEWSVKQMASWGFENGHLEPWDFGHPGWLNERFSAHIVSPVKEPLVGEVLSWTPGTNGTVTSKAVLIAPPSNPTKEELDAYLGTIAASVKGKIVLVGKPVKVAVVITPAPKRLEDQSAKARFSGDGPQDQRPFGPQGPPQPPQPGKLNSRQVAEILDAFLVANGAAIKVEDGGREHRQIRAFNNRTFDLAKAVPTVILTNEDYGRISRILDDGTTVELEFNIVNKSFPEGTTAYNVVSEIPGTDKKDEVIMLGGHLDSWHAATGATDNAIGCATMMEAARILKAIGVKPRRTIRVALWGGEEQGLLGSQAYVKEHFGSFEEPKPDFEKFGGYFNIDSGTGRARGMSIFGPSQASQALRDALKPFEDLGFFGSIPSRSRGLGGSDNTSFNQSGLPGIGIAQDPIEYGTATWHTNLDTFERIIEDDARKSAIVIAAAVYFLAMRDEMLPRFPKDQMPPKPAQRP
ncbi:MAG: M20/M25/M40 family metallo-hydrolase [Acidobacteria bacterium]|nr:M20/M25/M40 family metallo-hydrolase [Acidobacteriota bacterium]